MGIELAVIGGDGTGPEVIHEAIKCLKAIDDLYKLKFSFHFLNYNGDRYLKEGKLLSNDDIQHLKKHDAILLGAIGHPDVKPGILEREILLKLRFDLDQYINLRPVKLYPNVYTPIKGKEPKDIDYVVIRENTGGLYSGNGGLSLKGTSHEVATQVMVYSRYQVERCLKYAFEMVIKRHQVKPWHGLTEDEKSKGLIGKLTLCGKSNVLTFVFDLWQRVFDELGEQYPQVKRDYVHVDAACIYMVECPERFDVIVTENMFGDIITDLAAVTQGGMGVAASGNINPEGVSMFEPIGGTAPSFTGLNQINPMAAIGACHLLLSHLGYKKEADALEAAKISVIQQLKSMQAGKMGYSTTEVGDLVVQACLNQK